jgi:hypothetical protein
MEYSMQLPPNYSEFSFGTLLPFASLLKGLKLLVVLLQKFIGYPFNHLYAVSAN